MNIAIVYASMSGNTEEVASLIEEAHLSEGHVVTRFEADLIGVREARSLATYDLVYFGSYTWADGVLPEEMKDALRLILKEESVPLAGAAVFGTGDRIFVHFCRAVDEMMYHLSKFSVPLAGEPLKIEQSPRNHPHLVTNWSKQMSDYVQEGVMPDAIRENQTIIA